MLIVLLAPRTKLLRFMTLAESRFSMERAGESASCVGILHAGRRNTLAEAAYEKRAARGLPPGPLYVAV